MIAWNLEAVNLYMRSFLHMSEADCSIVLFSIAWIFSSSTLQEDSNFSSASVNTQGITISASFVRGNLGYWARSVATLFTLATDVRSTQAEKFDSVNDVW